MPEMMNARLLPDINDVAPLSVDDVDCLAEIRIILERHDALHRFGIALLHAHFPLDEDEVLLEHVDEESRTLIHRVVKRADLAGSAVVGTIWRLADMPTSAMEWDENRVQPLAKDLCRNLCVPEKGGHKGRHKPIGN